MLFSPHQTRREELPLEMRLQHLERVLTDLAARVPMQDGGQSPGVVGGQGKKGGGVFVSTSGGGAGVPGSSGVDVYDGTETLIVPGATRVQVGTGLSVAADAGDGQQADLTASGISVEVNGGAAVGPRLTLNLIPGAGVGTPTAVDNPGQSRIDVTLNAAGSPMTWLAYYALEDPSTTAGLADATVYGNKLTGLNTPGVGTGKLGKCFAPSAIKGDSVFTNSPDNLTINGVFTVYGWVQIASKSIDTIIAQGPWSSGTRSWNLYYDHTADRFKFQVSSDGTAITTVTGSSLGAPTLNTWYFLVGQYDGANLTLYINNVANTSVYSSGVFAGAGVTMGTGAALIDAVGIVSGALGTDFLTRLYNGGSGWEWPYISG